MAWAGIFPFPLPPDRAVRSLWALLPIPEAPKLVISAKPGMPLGSHPSCLWMAPLAPVLTSNTLGESEFPSSSHSIIGISAAVHSYTCSMHLIIKRAHVWKTHGYCGQASMTALSQRNCGYTPQFQETFSLGYTRTHK